MGSKLQSQRSSDPSSEVWTLLVLLLPQTFIELLSLFPDSSWWDTRQLRTEAERMTQVPRKCQLSPQQACEGRSVRGHEAQQALEV